MRNILTKLRETLAAELLLIAQEAAELARDMAPEGKPPRDEPRLRLNGSPQTPKPKRP